MSHPTGTPTRFSISATFTAEPIEPVLRFWARTLGFDLELRFAAFNQLHQTLLDPTGAFSANAHGFNIALLRWEDLNATESYIDELIQAIRAAAGRLASPLIVCACPPSPAFPRDTDASLTRKMSAALDELPAVHFLEHERIEHLYPVERWYDGQGEKLARIPYTEAWFVALGTSLVRLAHTLSRTPLKVAAVDCDNTLWRGVCGEDGPLGISIDAPFHALQCFLLEQHDDGLLLCINSKNNPDDVHETFAQNPDMPLQLRHFAATRLNWEPKAQNMTSLARELSLSLDGFIFLDDNPRDCAEVEDALPEVITIALPPNPDDIPHFLEHVWAFDRPVVTEEDRRRNLYYEQAIQFSHEAGKAATLEEFIAGLKLKADIEPLGPEHLARAAQLTRRTNQFNFTTIRRTEAEIAALLRDPAWACYTVHVSDRFGDYGIVGVIITERRRDSLVVDTFLLSCRVLGRGVEHRMLNFLGRAARGLRRIELRFTPSAKNTPAKSLLASIGPISNPAEFENLRWTLPTAEEPSAPASKRVAPPIRALDYAQIARDLATPTLILAAMKQPVISTEPMSDVERQLGSVWADLLQLPSVSPSDNFFDLGGHSLLAVLLLLRIKEIFDVELSIDDVYSGSMTLRDLSARIEAAHAGYADPEEYERLLAEIESMSDEQVREILAEAERSEQR